MQNKAEGEDIKLAQQMRHQLNPFTPKNFSLEDMTKYRKKREFAELGCL